MLKHLALLIVLTSLLWLCLSLATVGVGVLLSHLGVGGGLWLSSYLVALGGAIGIATAVGEE